MNFLIPIILGITAIAVLAFIGFPIYLGYTHRHYGQTVQTVAEATQSRKYGMLLGIGLILMCVFVDVVLWFPVGFRNPDAYVFGILLSNSILFAWVGLIFYLGWLAHRRAKELRALQPSETTRT